MLREPHFHNLSPMNPGIVTNIGMPPGMPSGKKKKSSEYDLPSRKFINVINIEF